MMMYSEWEYWLEAATLVFGAILLALICGLGLWWTCRSIIHFVMRRPIERSVIANIATVVRQNLPLGVGLTLAARGERGAARRILLRVAQLVNHGARLSEALRLGYPDCSAAVATLLAAGERAGQLPAALDQAEHYIAAQQRRWEPLDGPTWPYFASLMAGTLVVSSLVLVLIVPRYREILNDYNVPMPPISLAFVQLGIWLAEASPLLLPLIALGLILSLWHIRRGRRAGGLSFISRAGDWLRWRIPGLRRLEFSEGMARMLRTLRWATRAGLDLPEAAALAATVDVNRQLQPRMQQFSELLAQGTPMPAAARRAGLGEVTAVALAGARTSASLDPALRYVADYHDAMISRTWIVLRNLAVPLSTLMVACVVTFIVLALFLPLVTLIDSVAIP